MDLQLRGRIIVVVGGTGLIGRAVMKCIGDDGAVVVAAARSSDADLQIDAREDLSVRRGLASVVRDYGRLDGVVVAAAPSAQSLDSTRNSEPAQVLEAFDAKALAFLRVANEAVQIMTAQGYGRIVGISGQNALLTGNITGTVRNAALIVVAKSLADSVAGTGVTVNSVSPGTVVEMPGADVAIGKGGESSPEDVARLVSYLVSPVSGAVSGESIAVGHRVRGVTSF